MENKSILEIAFEVIKESKEPVPFKELFEKTLERSGLTPSDNERKHLMSSLYTQLTFDGRLFQNANKWDLRDRNKFEQYYRDLSELDDVDEEIDDEEEKALQKEESGELSYDESEQNEGDESLSDFENKKSNEEDF